MINLQALIPNSVETISITAIVDTALCVGAGGSSGSLADKPVVRTADDKLLIPASQVKGCLRHECEKLARGLGWAICQSPIPQTMCPQRAGFSEEMESQFRREDYQVEKMESQSRQEDYQGKEDNYHCLVCQIFGNPALPSRILCDDLICSQDPQNLPEVVRPGVTINRRRRTAEDRKLYFLETSPANTKLRFKGSITFLSNCPEQGKALIQAAFKHIHALGSSKSTGLGWLHWDLEFSVSDRAWTALLPGGEQ